MARARLATHGAFALVLLVGASVAVGGAPPATTAPGTPAATATWPPSDGLLVAEVVTGEASASDEFVELANAGQDPLDLAGLEVAYVTSSGSTVTRKVAWTSSVIVGPGRHILLANALGRYASIADATWSGGLAATGGTIVLRPVGGAPIDAVGWGDAVNAFVEGAPAPAPPAGSSLERLPGGATGNVQDTNDNLVDFLVNPTPVPQNLAAPPAPAPGPTGSPTPDPGGSPSPEPTASPGAEPTDSPPPSAAPSSTPQPTVAPSPEPSGSPVLTPSPSATPTATPTVPPTPGPSPTPVATATPAPTAAPTAGPTPSPSPSTTPSPEPSPSGPAILPIGTARLAADGTVVDVEGVVTAALGSLEGGRGGFIQDGTGGIAIYLDAEAGSPVPVATLVRARGVVDDRYAQRTVRLAIADLAVLGPAPLPPATRFATGEVDEHLEGRRIEVEGTIVASPDALADGTGLLVDDGTGPVRVIVGLDALAGLPLRAGDRVRADGPLGQRDSTGTGLVGYRVHVTLPGALEPLPPPEPSPSPSASPTPSPDPSAAPSPTPSPTTAPPTPTPAPSDSIATVRRLPIGSTATVLAVVTAEPGRLGTPALFSVGDATAGLVVRLPDGSAPAPRAALVVVTGVLASPFGQLELRPRVDGITAMGVGTPPAPHAVEGAVIGEETEGRLISLAGTLTGRPERATSGDLSAVLTADDGTAVRLMADASAGLRPERLVVGRRYAITGIAGQRASRKDVLDGYRVWLRDANDVVRLDVPAMGDPGTHVTPIAQARLALDETVVIEGLVTAPATLLDSTGRRTVIEDATGAIELHLSGELDPPAVGSLVRASGVVGRAYDAPRLRAATVAIVGTRPALPMRLVAAPGPAHEWRLVTLTGTVVGVRRLGDRWWAELQVGRERVPIAGLAGSGIAAPASAERRLATVTGIVRRPYPTATDRRFTVVPRGPRDLSVGPVTAARRSPAGAAPAVDGLDRPGRASPEAEGSGPLDVDLAELDAWVGRTVRVGGLVVDLRADGLVLDDGTARGVIVLRGTARPLLPLLAPGDALNLVGRPEADPEPRLVVDDPGGVLPVGEPVWEAASPRAPGRIGGAVARAPLSSSSASDGADGGLPGTLPALLGLLGIVVAVAATWWVAVGRRGDGTGPIRRAWPVPRSRSAGRAAGAVPVRVADDPPRDRRP